MTSSSGVRVAFNKSASSYDASSQLQQITGNALIDLVSKHQPCANHIIDLGCGTGAITERLARKFEPNELVAIDFADKLLAIADTRLEHLAVKTLCADFTKLPIFSNPFDLMFSNMALHWDSELESTIRYFLHQLSDRGMFAFSIPLKGTLSELRPSFSLNEFSDEKIILAQLQSAGFQILDHCTETITLTFDDTLSALKSIKQVGANFVSQSSAKHLRGRSFLSAININQLTYKIGYFISTHQGQACQSNYLLREPTLASEKPPLALNY